VRILLDECLPSQLTQALSVHEVRTVRQQGWLGLLNGELLAKACGNFDVFLTIDKRIQHDHAAPADLAIITLKARSNRMQDLLPLVPALLSALERVEPGTFFRLGA
jgi:hypothetical protein